MRYRGWSALNQLEPKTELKTSANNDQKPETHSKTDEIANAGYQQ